MGQTNTLHTVNSESIHAPTHFTGGPLEWATDEYIQGVLEKITILLASQKNSRFTASEKRVLDDVEF